MSEDVLEILDTTLRDGSYVIDFQFTAEDTALIASTLEAAGIGLIEVAHGLGLGAAREGHGDQASTDRETLETAASVLKEARFGAFFIPGIGNHDDLELAADCGVHFIRVGTNITDLEEAQPYVEHAKRLGMTAFCNLMKSYAVSPEEFGRYGKMAEDFGADVLCLVDSAGGMLPEDVRRYLEAAREACGLRLGFHGHNNLSMAVANTLEAQRAGATVLDASLQGMGRSEGNAMTEILVAIVQEHGLLRHIDVHALLDASEAFIRPLLHNTGYSGLGITSGRAQFHSSFLTTVLDAAKEFGIDPRDLILRLCEHDKVNAPLELVERLAREIAAQGPRSRTPFALASSVGGRPEGLVEQVRERAEELKEKARKNAISSVLNIVVGPYEGDRVSPYVETGFGCALSNIMLHDPRPLDGILECVDGIVDYVLLDPGDAPVPTGVLTRSVLLTYSDHEMWARAATSHLASLLDGGLHGKTIVLTGVEALTGPAAHLLAAAGAEVLPEAKEDGAAKAHAVVALSPRKPCIDARFVDAMDEGALLYDGGIGSLEPDAVAAAEAKGIQVVRVDMRPTLAATALEHISMKNIVGERMGRETWNGVRVVAGGLIGNRGEVVVDNIHNPTHIFGIADGKGGILEPEGMEEAVRKVRKAIAERKLRSQ